jgi:uncharacterized protein DUF2695
MLSPEEKLKRQALKQAARQAECDSFRASLPIPVVQMRAMFDFIDQQLRESECDNTLRHTLLFLSQNKLKAGPVIHWLEENHGYCDCEVLANTEERFIEAFPD